jgi:branched-chain amino acid transport system permease protein
MIPFYAPDYYVSLLVSIYLYVILTVSWAMFSAPTGYMSLATATFFGVGIYTTAVIGETIPLFIVICLGGLFSFLIALLVGLACMRLRGIYFAIFTFGLTELILHALLFYELEVTGQVGRLVVEMDAMIVYYAMLFVVVIVLLTVFIIKHSKYGLALQANILNTDLPYKGLVKPSRQRPAWGSTLTG